MFDGALFIQNDKDKINLEDLNNFIQIKYAFPYFNFTFKEIKKTFDIKVPDDYVFDKLAFVKQHNWRKIKRRS